MTLAGRRREELKARLASIEHDFDSWEALSEPGEQLEKHRSQVRRVTRQLREYAAEARARFEPPEAAGMKNPALIDLLVLDLHAVWGVFSSKLALRCVPHYRPHLLTADDLAWACYEPARDLALRHGLDLARVREPPLVYLSGEATPVALGRGSRYGALVTGGLFGPTLLPALRALPLPLIGLPWHQVEHVPDLLAVGHEVGHHVEDDLGLTDSLGTELDGRLAEAGVPPERRTAWRTWLGEVFADVYGCMATGPAFAGWLFDRLAAVPRTSVAETPSGPDWGAYPSPEVRVRLVHRSLVELEFATEADALLNEWCADRAGISASGFDRDVDTVIDAILGARYPQLGGASLEAAITFSTAHHKQAIEDAGSLLSGHDPRGEDVRILVAAAAQAFRRKPPEFHSACVSATVLDRAVALRASGPRVRRKSAEPPADALAESDRAAGRRLFELIARGRAGELDRASKS